MTMRQDVQDKARALGCRISPDLKEMIRCIQRAEGQSDCFGTGRHRECGRFLCGYRAECAAAERQ